MPIMANIYVALIKKENKRLEKLKQKRLEQKKTDFLKIFTKDLNN